MPFARRAAVAVLCTLALAGCGSREPSDQEQVRTLLADFATATSKKDYGTLCDRIFAPVLLNGIKAIGLPCEVAMRNSLGEVSNPRMTVGTVEIKGKTARVEIRTSADGQEPSRDTLELVKSESGWKVSSLGAAPSASATPAP